VRAPHAIFRIVKRTEKQAIVLATAALLATFALGTVAVRQLAFRSKAVPPVALSGRFHQVTHLGSGAASIFVLPDGRRMLRLSQLRVQRRDDLQVYLLAAPDAFDNETVENSEYVALGPLGTGEARLEYQVPVGLDLARYRAVSIWSQKYRVNFITAPLGPPQ
jgi:hypothetical protein